MSKSKIVEETPVPSRSTPEWTEYILNQLTEEEKFNDVPRMEGLRRMVEVNVSPIIKMDVDITTSEGQTLTVIAKATVSLGNGQTYSACSDANFYSCQGEFKNRLTATADTRAKSKVFREILALRNTFTAEEAITVGDENPEDDSFITESQIIALQRECSALSIDIDKAMSHFMADPPNSVKKIRMSQATILMGQLNDLKRGRKPVPKEILQGT